MTNKEVLKIISYDILDEKPIFSEEEHIEAYQQIEKDLKLLELLKKKEVDINCVKYTATVESYNTYYIFDRWKLTQEEYDLIKEWLECN